MKPHSSEEPHDRLTRLCAEMTTVLETAENADVKAAVFLVDDSMAGLQFHGYEDSIAGVADVFIHLQAVFEANGKKLDFVSLDDGGATKVPGGDGR